MISHDSLLTPEIVASLLGVNRRTIYNMVSAGEIPGAVHLGRRLRFNTGAIRAWLRILRRNGRGKAA